MTPKFRNRAERRAWLDAHVTDPAWIPAGYEPEPWDVIKDGTTVVVHGVGIDAAESAARFLNEKNRPHEYELVLTGTALANKEMK